MRGFCRQHILIQKDMLLKMKRHKEREVVKMFKKLWALMIAVAMLLGCVVPMTAFAATETLEENSEIKSAFADAANSPYVEEINLLNAISVLVGDDAGNFRPNDTVSRAEMATIVVRISGMESSVIAGETEFDDVPSSHWASGYIKLASNMGIINGDGDGKFRPDDKVTYNEAVKMLVCVLGYGVKAVEVGPWPTGYLVTADDLKINDEVLVQTGQASRETVAKLVANSLDVDYLEKSGFGENTEWTAVTGRTLLSEKLQITKVEDIVTESAITSTVGTGSLRDHEVKINDVKYYVGDTDIAKHVGYPVVAYAKLDKKVDKQVSTIVHYELDTENVKYIRITGEDIASATASAIHVFESKESTKTDEYLVAAGALKIVNGAGNMGYDLSKLDPNAPGSDIVGEVVMIDKGEDDIIDTFFISASTTFVLSAVRKANDGFYLTAFDLDADPSNDRLPSTGKYDLTNKNLKLNIIKDGKEVEYTDLEEYDVISYSTDGANIHNFTVSNEKVTGTIEKLLVTENKIVIDGNEYEYSSVLPASKKGSVGDSLTLYLDQFGKVAYTTKEASATAQDYAYLMGVAQEGVGTINANEWGAKIFTQKDGVQTLTFADRVNFINNGNTNALNSGNPYDNTSLATGLEAYGLTSSGVSQPQLIKFAANSDGKIITIETAVQIPSTVIPTKQTNEQAAVFRRNMFEGSGGSFYAPAAGFRGKKDYSYSSAQLLFLPSDTSGNVIEEDIAFVPATMFFNDNGTVMHTASEFELYDIDQEGNISIIVAKISSDSAEYKEPRNATFYIVTDVSNAVVDGEKVVRVSGYSARYRAVAKGITSIDIPLNADALPAPDAGPITPDKPLASDIKVGDIISVVPAPNGKVYAYNVYYSYHDDINADSTYDGGGKRVDQDSTWNYNGAMCGSFAAGSIIDYYNRNGSELITFKAAGSERELDLATETGVVLKFDVAKGEIVEMDIADLPLPEDTNGDGVNDKLPKVMIRAIAGTGDLFTISNFVYIDDGTF